MSDEKPSVDGGAFGQLIARVYPTLQRMAAAKVRGSGLSPSSVVQDTLIRVLKLPSPPQSEPQLEAAAWKLMEWVVLDKVRSEQARDHRERASMDARSDPWQSPQLEHLSRAMSELAKLDPRRAEVVTLCLACGLPMTRVAELLDISVRTVQRDLEFSKAWLAVCIERQETHRPSDAQSIPAAG